MSDIIKTWPAIMPRQRVLEAFSAFGTYYFTIGRGKPKHNVEKLWFTHHGRIIGNFQIEEFVQNDGSLPRLSRIDGSPSEWQIKPDAWVAICPPPFVPLKEVVFFPAFRGFRYFSFDEYRGTMEAKVRI